MVHMPRNPVMSTSETTVQASYISSQP